MDKNEFDNKSLLGNIWQINNVDERLVLSSSQKNDISPLLAKLLLLRNINENLVSNFLLPDFKNNLPDPFLLNDMKKSVDRVIYALKNDEKLKDTDALKKIVEHLDIINNDMLSIFKKNNIEPIKSINEKLDPNLHQAMMEVEDETKEPGTIVQEIQKGFMMKERLLRPSLVGVSKKKAKEEQNEGEKDEKNQ